METLDKHFRELTRAAFARYGFAYAELIGRWPAIVGDAVAQACEPERIKWPRAAGESAQKQGGTLVIRAAPGRGLDLQHETPRIIERINGFYGYGAIAAVKIMQGRTGGKTSAACFKAHPPPVPVKLDGIAADPAQSGPGTTR